MLLIIQFVSLWVQALIKGTIIFIYISSLQISVNCKLRATIPAWDPRHDQYLFDGVCTYLRSLVAATFTESLSHAYCQLKLYSLVSNMAQKYVYMNTTGLQPRGEVGTQYTCVLIHWQEQTSAVSTVRKRVRVHVCTSLFGSQLLSNFSW